MVANVVKLKLNGCDSANVPHVFKFGRLNLEIYFQVRGALLDNKQSYVATVKASSMKEIKGAGSSFCIVARLVPATLKESTGGA